MCKDCRMSDCNVSSFPILPPLSNPSEKREADDGGQFQPLSMRHLWRFAICKFESKRMLVAGIRRSLHHQHLQTPSLRAATIAIYSSSPFVPIGNNTSYPSPPSKTWTSFPTHSESGTFSHRNTAFAREGTGLLSQDDNHVGCDSRVKDMSALVIMPRMWRFRK